MKVGFQNVDDYILEFPLQVQEILSNIRQLILETAPESVENISYGIPAYKLKGKPLVYFAGYKNHIGFYATPQGHENFAEELSNFKQGKGSVQFPLSKPIPFDLIKRVVEFKKSSLK
ncbi:MAG TPA: DUF1801 domain-containing protein [Pedobacter sp.]|jgi:uncharacterized protein YdhG (YjbR/CyaY superfamily)